MESLVNWNLFLNHVPSKPSEGIYRIFDSQCKDEILKWLEQEDVASEQKEEFIKALIEFDDECSNLYRYQAFFLATAGIAKFRECSLGDEIAKQLVEWRIRVTEKGFLKDNVIAAFQETDQDRVTLALIDYLDRCENESVRINIIKVLAQSTSKTTDVINSLIKVIETTENNDTRREAAISLGRVEPGNKIAIKTIVTEMRNAKPSLTRPRPQLRSIFELGLVSKGDETIINALNEIIQLNRSNDLTYAACVGLDRIDPGNCSSLPFLINLIRTTEDEFNRSQMAVNLDALDPGNEIAFTTITQLLKTDLDERTQQKIIRDLHDIAIPNQNTLNSLIELLETAQNHSVAWAARICLGRNFKGNANAIKALENLIKTNQNEHTRHLAATSLQEIDSGNEIAIPILIQPLLKSFNDGTFSRDISKNLLNLGKEKENIINALIQFLETNPDLDNRWDAAYYLAQIDPGNIIAINVLGEIVESLEDDENLQFIAAEELLEIDPINEKAFSTVLNLIINSDEEVVDTWRFNQSLDGSRFSKVVTVFKNHLPNTKAFEKLLNDLITDDLETIICPQCSHGNPKKLLYQETGCEGCDYYIPIDHYIDCAKVLWHCAKNMSYPEFYEVWHS